MKKIYRFLSIICLAAAMTACGKVTADKAGTEPEVPKHETDASLSESDDGGQDSYTTYMSGAGDQVRYDAENADSAESGDEPVDYRSVTSLDKEEVEAFAASVRQAYLAEDWGTIATMIRYPINMYPDVTVTDEAGFLAYMDGKAISGDDRSVMEQETCKDMFVNGEGICMGSGQIWINDISYMTEQEPCLQIIAVSGVGVY